MKIIEYTVEHVKDPFGILSGKRYEFKLDLELEEDDDLFAEKGVYARVIYKSDGEQSGIVTCDWMEKTTDRFLDLEVEEEERAELAAFCEQHLSEADAE